MITIIKNVNEYIYIYILSAHQQFTRPRGANHLHDTLHLVVDGEVEANLPTASISGSKSGFRV